MAELHGRIRRVQDFRVTLALPGSSCRLAALLVCVVVVVGGYTQRVAAQATPDLGQWVDGGASADELAALGDQLTDPDEGRRRRAFEMLHRLPSTALDAIGVRFAALSRAGLRTEDLVAALTAFRRAVGSTRADDNVDLAAGILLVTRADRARTVARAAEILLMLRSLEALGTPAAGMLIADGLAIDTVAFAQEAVRVRARLGLKLVPSLIALRGHRTPDIRRWAGRGLKLLSVTDPVVATQHGSPEELAATLDAYGSTHDLEALPVMVSFMNDARIQVRTAARNAVRALGRNAIWKLRIAYQEVTGTSANPQWNSEKTLDELCVVFDRARIERAETALGRGLNAHLGGNLLLMEEQFEQALRIDPQLARKAEMAPGFAALGVSRSAQDNLDRAQSAYRRALRLAPEHADARVWEAEISYLAAERALSRGVVDMEGYRGTLALVSDHEKAAEAIDRLSGAWSERIERSRRIVAVLAIVLLSCFGFGVLRARRPVSATSPTDHATATTP